MIINKSGESVVWWRTRDARATCHIRVTVTRERYLLTSLAFEDLNGRKFFKFPFKSFRLRKIFTVLLVKKLGCMQKFKGLNFFAFAGKNFFSFTNANILGLAYENDLGFANENL